MAIKNKGGRPSFTPNKTQKKLVAEFTRAGAVAADIARALEISEPTLRKYFRDELDIGLVDANRQVAGALFKAALKGNVTAQIFWLKTRAGWHERNLVEHTGKDGDPIEVRTIERKIIDPIHSDTTGIPAAVITSTL